MTTLTVKARPATLTVKAGISPTVKAAISRTVLAGSPGGVYTPSRLMLEDGSGFWLFEDSTLPMYDSGDTGNPSPVKSNILTVTIQA